VVKRSFCVVVEDFVTTLYVKSCLIIHSVKSQRGDKIRASVTGFYWR